ncbi:hypothetical protein ACQ4LE_008036, partial [Meloidogyne hapla]
MDNAENEEKNDKENHEKPIKFEINNQKQFFKKEDEVKECEEESKNVNEFEEDQGTNETENQQQKFSKEEDDTLSFSSASTLFTSNNNFSSSFNNSLHNSFKIKRKAIVERQFSRKSVTFRKDSFIQKLDKNKKDEEIIKNKYSMQLVSKLFGFVRGKLGRCSLCCNNQRVVKEEKNENSKHKNIPDRGEKRRKSSIRKPKLLGMRQRESVILNKTENQTQIFEKLLNLYNSPKDVVNLRNNPEQLIQLGIDSKQFSAILEELYFYLQKSEQLKE